MVNLTKIAFHILSTNILEDKVSAEDRIFNIDAGFEDKSYVDNLLISFLVNGYPVTIEYMKLNNRKFLVAQFINNYKKVYELECFDDYLRITNSKNQIICQIFLKQNTNTGVIINYGKSSASSVSLLSINPICDNKYQIRIRDIYIKSKSLYSYKLTELIDIYDKINLLTSVHIDTLKKYKSLDIKDVKKDKYVCNLKKINLCDISWNLIENEYKWILKIRENINNFSFKLISADPCISVFINNAIDKDDDVFVIERDMDKSMFTIFNLHVGVTKLKYNSNRSFLLLHNGSSYNAYCEYGTNEKNNLNFKIKID